MPRQKGLALITLVFLVGLAAVAYLLQGLDGNAVRIERDKKTAAALAEAKAALMGRALLNSNPPGSFPCPSANDQGSPAPFVAGNHCKSYLGRLPWKHLGLSKLADGNDELLWYALSADYRDSTSVEPLNGTKPGTLTVDAANDIVAVIFSPSVPLAGQARPSNNASDYLEGTNSNGDLIYTGQQSQLLNDRVIYIRRTELLAPLSLQILNEIKGSSTEGALKYFTQHDNFPFADTNNDGSADAGKLVGTPSFNANVDDLNFPTAYNRLHANGWFSQVLYIVAPDQKTLTLSLNGKTVTAP